MSAENGQQWLRDKALDILDAAVDAIITINANGTIQSVNRATLELFGFSAEELIGQPIETLIPLPHRAQHQGYIDHYLRTGEARIIGIGRELTAQKKDGTVFPMSLAISEINSDSGPYFAGIVRDLTDQKAALEALSEQRERLARVGRLSIMGEMTASIAHEINQPLTAISMYAQACVRLLENDRADQGKLRAALEKLNKQSLRAGAVIERIQRFVRNEDGQRETVDLNRLTEELGLLVSADARLHSIDLQFELEPDLPPVFCDPVQIQQVILNLVRNAIDAMYTINCANGNRILVTTRRLGAKGVALSVRDCGTGIAEDQQGKVFTAFHSTKAEGMGMGLSICRSIIQAHLGKLTFTNNADYGCTFTLTLPLETEHD
ncbi:MAG: two-component system sensor histidine kinase NtrB [Pseudomonadales bacterium]